MIYNASYSRYAACDVSAGRPAGRPDPGRAQHTQTHHDHRGWPGPPKPRGRRPTNPAQPAQQHSQRPSATLPKGSTRGFDQGLLSAGPRGQWVGWGRRGSGVRCPVRVPTPGPRMQCPAKVLTRAQTPQHADDWRRREAALSLGSRPGVCGHL